MKFKKMKLVYPAHSKHFFFFRMHISKFILQKNCVPLNPFMIFEYFMLDTISRNKIRNANNNLVKKADEIWVFGPISDGVFDEIELARGSNKPIQYFAIRGSKKIIRIPRRRIITEKGLENLKNKIIKDIWSVKSRSKTKI